MVSKRWEDDHNDHTTEPERGDNNSQYKRYQSGRFQCAEDEEREVMLKFVQNLLAENFSLKERVNILETFGKAQRKSSDSGKESQYESFGADDDRNGYKDVGNFRHPQSNSSCCVMKSHCTKACWNQDVKADSRHGDFGKGYSAEACRNRSSKKMAKTGSLQNINLKDMAVNAPKGVGSADVSVALDAKFTHEETKEDSVSEYSTAMIEDATDSEADAEINENIAIEVGAKYENCEPDASCCKGSEIKEDQCWEVTNKVKSYAEIVRENLSFKQANSRQTENSVDEFRINSLDYEGAEKNVKRHWFQRKGRYRKITEQDVENAMDFVSENPESRELMRDLNPSYDGVYTWLSLTGEEKRQLMEDKRMMDCIEWKYHVEDIFKKQKKEHPDEIWISELWYMKKKDKMKKMKKSM